MIQIKDRVIKELTRKSLGEDVIKGEELFIKNINEKFKLISKQNDSMIEVNTIKL